jgi:hypothetical protein
VRQKNRQAWLLLLRPAAENPRSTLSEQVSESAEIWVRDPIEGAEMLTSKWNTLYFRRRISRLLRVDLLVGIRRLTTSWRPIFETNQYWTFKFGIANEMMSHLPLART